MASTLYDLRVGIHYAWQHPILKWGAIFFFGTNFAINLFNANFMYYLAHSLQLNSTHIGLVFAISGIGAICGSLFAPYFIHRFPSGRLIVIYTTLAGAATFLLLGLHNPLLVAIAWGIVLCFGAANVVTYFTYRQKVVPDAYLGRSIAITRLIAFGSIPIASVLGGLLLKHTSIELLIFLCAAIRLLVGLLAAATPLNRPYQDTRTSHECIDT